MKMDEILDSLKINNPTNDKPITHTLMNGGKIHVPENKLNLLYKKIIKYGIEQNETIQLVERMGEIHPFIVDIDIKYNNIIDKRQYTSETVQEIVTFLWAKLTEFFDVEDKSHFGEIWVMEKDIPYPCPNNKQYEYKDGIHIAFPKILIKKESYKKCIEIMKQEKQIESIFDHTCEITPDNDENTLFDGCFSSWQPYGCSKKNESYYKLTKVFSIDENDIPQLIEADIIKDFYNEPMKIITEMSMCYRKEETVKYLPILNNVLNNGFKNSVGNNNNEPMNQQNGQIPDIYGAYYIDNDNIINPYQIVEAEELKLVKSLVKCLSAERADDYGKWFDVALCLHNINKDNLLDDWKEFSSQSDSYNSGECDLKWNSINTTHSGTRLGIGSLMFWAKNDNEEEFIKAKNDSLKTYIHKSVRSGADADYLVSKVIHKYYEDEFISVNVKDEWFHFNGTRWERTLEGTSLKTRIHNDIFKLYGEYTKHYTEERDKEIQSMTNDGMDATEVIEGKSGYGKLLKNIMYIQMKLLQGNYVNGLMKNLRDLFYKKEVMEKFDIDNDLLGFENGIYDLKYNVFREGRPEDYVTLSTRVTIPVKKSDMPLKLDDMLSKFTEVDNYDTFLRDMDDFIDKIVPVPAVKEYTLRFLSKCFSGENRDEGFYIWTGTGGNGKSKLIDLMNMCMGDYACNLPVALLTQKRKASGAASPEMAVTKGKRLCVMQEPDVNETLNVGQMKEITGNDTIQARGLYKEPFEFTPQFKLIMMCNDLPNIPSNDDGTWRRLEVVDFVARFVDEPSDISPEYHRYLKDKTIKKKIPMWVLPFYSVILPQWRLYNIEGITIPKEVGAKTNDYRNNNDIVGQWITDQCEQADNELSADGVSESAPSELKYLYSEFKDWCEDEEVSREIIPEKNKFKEALKKWQGKSKYGLKLGTRKTDKYPNGCDSAPKFNLKVT